MNNRTSGTSEFSTQSIYHGSLNASRYHCPKCTTPSGLPKCFLSTTKYMMHVVEYHLEVWNSIEDEEVGRAILGVCPPLQFGASSTRSSNSSVRSHQSDFGGSSTRGSVRSAPHHGAERYGQDSARGDHGSIHSGHRSTRSYGHSTRHPVQAIDEEEQGGQRRNSNQARQRTSEELDGVAQSLQRQRFTRHSRDYRKQGVDDDLSDISID